MADVLGLSVPHLNRVMQQLRADRLITSRSRIIELNDLTSLQALAQYQPLDLARIPAPTEKASNDEYVTVRFLHLHKRLPQPAVRPVC